MARQTRRTRVLSIRSRCRRSPSRRDRARSPKSYLSAKRRHRQHRCAPSDSIPRAATAENQSLEIKPDRGPGGAPLQPVPSVRSARAGCRAVRTARSWRGIVSFAHLAREGRMTVTIGRRELLVALGGAAAVWPLAAQAQQGDRVRRVGIVMPYPRGDSENEARVRAFKQELAKLGWTDGGNIRFDERWTTDDMSRVWSQAASLMASNPDVVVATGGRVVPVLMQLSSSIPIVLPGAGDPVRFGYAKSLARPGGNVTGFALLELSMLGKSLEILKQIAPAVVCVALIYNPDNPSSVIFTQTAESASAPLGIEPIAMPIHGLEDIKRPVAGLADGRKCGVFFLPDVTTLRLRCT